MRTIELRMDITNTCNLRCIMCHLPYLHQSPHMMSAEDFRRITGGILLDVNTMYLSWATEPMINPHLPEIIDQIKRAKIPCVVMVSNLTHLPNKTAEVLNGIHRLHVSIDSADKTTYAVIRQKDCFDQVYDNVRKIQNLKRERGWKYPRIAFNAVLLRMNIHQLKSLVECAVSLNVNELNLSYISIPLRYNDGTINQKIKGLPDNFDLKNEAIRPDDPEARAILHDTISYAEKRGVIITVPGRFSILGNNSPAGQIDKIKFMLRKGLHFPSKAIWHLAWSYLANFTVMRKSCCTFPFRQIVLTADGLVLPCCVWDDNDSFGNINHGTLSEIWGGEAFKKLRSAMISDTIPPACAACTRVNSKRRHGI